MKDLKEFTVPELEAELLEKKDNMALRNQLLALRNQLLGEVKKGIEYNEETNQIIMKKQAYDILIADWESTTDEYKN